MSLSTQGVRALLFDLGGVLLENDFNRSFAVWARLSGKPIETVKARFSVDTSYERYERGEITARAYFACLRLSLGIDLSDDEFMEGWNAIFVGTIPQTADLLRRLKNKIPIYAFTNSNRAHQVIFEKEYAEELRSFRKVFVSSDLGKRKPEPAAFAAVAAEIGVRLDEILFFDDTRENVEGARVLGMHAVHVKSITDIESGVAEFLR